MLEGQGSRRPHRLLPCRSPDGARRLPGTGPGPRRVHVELSTCGFTQADFKKSGRLGCPDCYRTFAEGLETLLKSMHKGTRHTGKTPGSPQPEAQAAQNRLQALQHRLTEAIAIEDYEEAARLRDQIKALKNSGGGVRTA